MDFASTPTIFGASITFMDLAIAQTVKCTEAEGPGKRYALWFQGCPLRCSGCCNPEMLPFTRDKLVSAESVLADIMASVASDNIEGVTFLGGEPLAHASEALLLAKELKKNNLTIMIFSGYVLSEALKLPNPDVKELLFLTDILVDGPYQKDLPETARRWIGSSNQKVHFLSDRYRLDEQWQKTNTLEIRLKDSEIFINGFPAKQAKSLWKSLKLPVVG